LWNRAKGSGVPIEAPVQADLSRVIMPNQPRPTKQRKPWPRHIGSFAIARSPIQRHGPSTPSSPVRQSSPPVAASSPLAALLRPYEAGIDQRTVLIEFDVSRRRLPPTTALATKRLSSRLAMAPNATCASSKASNKADRRATADVRCLPAQVNDHYPDRHCRTGHRSHFHARTCSDLPTRHIPGTWGPTAQTTESPGHVLGQCRRNRCRMCNRSRPHWLGAVGIGIEHIDQSRVVGRPVPGKLTPCRIPIRRTARKPAEIRHADSPENPARWQKIDTLKPALASCWWSHDKRRSVALAVIQA